MPSEDKVKALILKSYLDNERSQLMEMSRRHHEINHDIIGALSGEPYVAFERYDQLLRDLLAEAETLRTKLTKRIESIE